MEAQARALEEEVRQLCEQEQTKQTALLKQRLYSRVGQFLMGSLDMRHWWCGYSPLMIFMMRVLELYPSSESVCVFYKRMEQQLGTCRKCVDIYHASMPSVHVELEYEFTPESIKAFFVKLQGLDADRIQRQLTDKSMGMASAFQETSETVALTLYEVLSQRRLLSDFRVVRVLAKWQSTRFADLKSNPSLESLRGCAGLYQLLVTPDSAVREWAMKMVTHFGNIQLTGDDGENREFLDVMDEWTCILESETFNKSVLSLGLRSTEDLENFLEPTSCIKTPTKKILWSALDHLMQQMDVHSLEAMLDAFDTIPGVVFDYLQGADPSQDQPVTLVVSKCFGVLLRCLGHRFWNHCAYTPDIVLDVVMQHCRLNSWRVFVTKQFIDLLPPLLVAMRPPHVSNQSTNPDNLNFYMKTRREILQFLIVEDLRPKHYDSIAIVASSRAAFTILSDCYEHRMLGSVKSKVGNGRDEGALSESISIDYSVSESAFWWPCGLGAGGDSNVQLEKLWMDHLCTTVVRPNNVESLVDLAAETTALILSKHLSLARHLVYSSIDRDDSKSTKDITMGKPIITDLLRKLCSWGSITTIPLQVHGALFESIGGISELLNGIEAQTNASENLQRIAETLRDYEAQTQQYLQKMCDEVLLKGLSNPFGFPVVSQHISACYLSPTSTVDQQVKRLIGQYAADKKRPTQVPSPLEALLISVHRNAEAFLRGQLSMLQSMRLYGFSQAVCLPVVRKLIFIWSRVFDMLGGDLGKAFQKASNARATTLSSNQVTDIGVAAAHLLKLPNLINDFLIALLTNLFDPKVKLTVEITEATRVQCLDFGISFWKFWMSVLTDPGVSSKRVIGLIAPLVECIARGSASENKRAAELLMTVLMCLLKGNTRLDETTLAMIDSIKSEAAAIESKQSTDFGRMTKKFRQLDQTSGFFTKRSTDSGGMKNIVDMTSRSKSKLPLRTKSSATMFSSATRPMSGKSATRAQSHALVDLTGIEEVSNEAAARRQHSFYSEQEYRASSRRESTPKGQASKSKTPFDMAQVIKGIAHSHPGSNKAVQSERTRQQTTGSTEQPEEEEEEEDTDLRFAALFHRIKTTRKPIAVCSLLPFYRQLLQVCMPVLLSGEFQNERSDKELLAPGLSFKKNADYVRAFLPLMVEECNNEVQEGLRKCSYSNGGHLLRYESEKPREGMRCISLSVVQRDEGLLASSQSKFGGKGRPGRRFNEKLFRNGDVVLLRIATGSQNQGDFMGKREFLGVILISEAEKGRRQTSSTKKSSKNEEEEETVKVLFLNDGELDNATASVRSFSTEVLAASAIAGTEWKLSPLCNLVTSAREYIALRSVDMLPEHLRTAILTPETYKSTQSELLTITSVLDELRGDKSSEGSTKIVKLLKRLDKMDVMLTDLRSTSIGKAVNKLRKHDDSEIKTRSSKLKDKWTGLMNKKDVLERGPRFLSPELWEAIKPQYNSSQLQSIHSVLNNYSMGVSLLQGPPGTGKTKTIMGLLSGLLSLRLPSTAVMPMISPKASPNAQGTKGDFSNFDAAKSRSVSSGQASVQASRASTPTFSLSGVTSALGSILRRPSDGSSSGPSRTSIQALKNVASSRSRLENKLVSRTPHPSSNLVVKRRIVSRAASERAASRTNNILLCAPSNGAVNELVLRIVTDGLMDSSGNITKVRAPSVHPDALSEEFISIVRLGNAGEDASEVVNSVCLPHIIRREMAIHPKAMQLHSLQDTQRQLRSSIRDFHNKTEEENGVKKDRKALAKMHQQLTECSGKIRRLRDEVSAIRARITETILSKASIIACTLSKAGSGDFSELKHGFDALIIDEAAQAVELSTLVPIRERVARVVLVGDPKQLPATVKSVVAAKARYDRSLFERIAESGVAPSMLRVQYRMHPFLRDFPSKRFYGGMLTDGPSVMERVQKVCPGVYARTSFQPFLLYDVSNSREEDMNGSKYNRVEAAFCISLCQNMFETCADVNRNKWSVGFVSPYKEQVRVLRQEITRSGIPASVSIEVNTVDGFQGREKDVIVFSCVRSSKRGGIGFLRDIRRLNVAITRARFCLFVVGNVNTLVRDETWAALVKSARDRKLIIRTEGEAFPSVAKRLESDKYRELAEYYKAMHEKAAQKSATVVKPTKTKEGKPDVKVEENIQEVKKERGNNGEIQASLQDKDKVTDGLKVDDGDKSIPTSVKIEPQPIPSAERPNDSHKRLATDVSNTTSVKKPRLSVTVQPTEADLRGQYEIRSFRDRGGSSTPDSRHLGDQSSTRATYHHAEPSKRDDRHADRSRPRDYKGSYDRANERKREGPSSRYRSDDQRGRDRDRVRQSSAERRSTSRPSSASVAPQSTISEKEFCQANEPPPPSQADRMRHNTPRMRGGKRPYPESSHPPMHAGPRNRDRPSYRHHDRPSSGRSSYHTVTNESRTPRNSGSARTPTSGSVSRSTNVLGNILGSASKLASATSRVQDKANPSSSEFS